MFPETHWTLGGLNYLIRKNSNTGLIRNSLMTSTEILRTTYKFTESFFYIIVRILH